MNTTNVTATNYVIYPIKSWWTYLMTTMSYLVVILNSLTMHIIARRGFTQHRTCKMCFCFLIISHLVVGVSGSIAFTGELFTNSNAHNRVNLYEDIVVSLYHASYTATFSGIVLVTLDRLIAIKVPFFYATLTRKFVLVCIAGGLLLPLAVFLLLITTPDATAYIIFMGAIFLSSLVLGISNMMVYMELKSHLKAILKTMVSNSDKERRNNEKTMYSRQLQAARVSLFIVISFILFWLPTGIGAAGRFLQGKHSTFSQNSLVYRLALGAFTYGNSLSDPIMYVLMNKEMKKELFYMLRKVRKGTVQREDVTMTTMEHFTSN
ncbi:uncharacterized protein LOC130646083 [Hydractinia symbiolongicarpus]|uniref:uncharacterized protein LOC130646083 n=1 Tax=Hydractinia symbiolongicarpus TaxID=13093 RepID=UPI00254B589F|nr:uncharacterized protein LOC130646083 [Hydractinia symbiolongicarpus]